MTLQEAFYLHIKKEKLFDQSDRVLIAVSTGVDSMVLLDLMRCLPVKARPEIGVVHFNHGLREQSVAEVQFLEEYCFRNQLPFYSEAWQVPNNHTLVSEVEAREARYGFFDRVCRRYQYTHLLTAHHGTDQVETILRRLVTGSYIWDMSGIPDSRKRETYQLVRPLLFASKAEIQSYAIAKDIPYFEDETNTSRDYQRNRIRHEWLPLIEKENSNYLQHFHHFITQLNYTEDIVSQVVTPIYDELIMFTENKWPQLNRPEFLLHPESLQYMVLTRWFNDTIISNGISVNHRQVQAILHMIQRNSPQKTYPLEKGWHVVTTYTTIELVRQPVDMQGAKRDHKRCSYVINVGDVIRVEPNIMFSLMKKETDDTEDDMSLTIQESDLPLLIRHPVPGDAFLLNREGNKKKVSRYFIDNKWSNEQRSHAWVVVNKHDEVLWIPPFRKSYLSIIPETDKIQYKLLYNKTDNSGGEIEC